MNRYLWPLGLFVVLTGFLFVGLSLNPREVPSPLIGKPAPAFSVSQLGEAGKTFAPADMKGKVWLLNVWASWCVACRQEHPVPGADDDPQQMRHNDADKTDHTADRDGDAGRRGRGVREHVRPRPLHGGVRLSPYRSPELG